MTENYKRDQLWTAVYDLYYYVYFDELISDELIKSWTWFDNAARVGIALSASSSAIAGWALWKQPTFKTVWAVIAGVGVVIAIVHTALGVSHHLRDLFECRSKLLRFRLDLQRFRTRMVIDPEFSIPSFENEFLRFHERWTNECQMREDLLQTKCLRNRVQDYLNVQIKQYDESDTGRAH